MKSDFGCPACALQLDWVPLSDKGLYRLFCASTHCDDEICERGSIVDTNFGQDAGDAHKSLLRRFEKQKEE